MVLKRCILIVLVAISASITGSLVILTKKRGNSSENKIFSLFLLAITVYSFGYTGELSSNTLPAMLFWSDVQYLGIAVIPPLWIMLALLYNGLEKWLTRPNVLLLFLIPILTLFFKITNFCNLFYIKPVLNPEGPFPIFAPIKGIWYWVNIAYLDLSLLVGILLFLLMWRRATALYHHQVILILVGFSIPWVGHLIYLNGFSPWSLDLGSLSLTLTALLFFWGFNTFHLFDIVPIARTKVLESIRDGILVLDIQNRIVDANTAAKQMLKLNEKSLGLNVDPAFSNYPLLLKQLVSHDEQAIIRIENGDRDQFIESRLNKIVNSFNKIIGYTVILADKSEQILLLNQLQTMATIDSLSNIFNRRYFFEESRKELLRLKQSALPVSLIVIDLDHFKEINDTYGHLTGDVVLQKFSANLRRGISIRHLLGRIGGEEFAVLLPELDFEETFRVAEQLRSLTDTVISINDLKIRITASFGVSSWKNAGQGDLDLLYSQADQALYRSKDYGRNRLTVFQK